MRSKARTAEKIVYGRFIFDSTTTYRALTVEVIIRSVVPEIRKLNSNFGQQVCATFIPYSKNVAAFWSNKIHKVTFEQC